MISIPLKNHVKDLYRRMGKYFPGVFYHLQYYRATKKIGNMATERNRLFSNLISKSSDKRCLQIGVKNDYGAKYGPHWIAVDLYDDRAFIDFHYDIHDLKFDDNRFDLVVCISILEHVPNPQKAIAELNRVLKPGGEVWVQLPFQFPYHEAPKDYWRVSPDGLRLWMQDFEEILCGSFLFTRTSLVTSTFFYGTKKLL